MRLNQKRCAILILAAVLASALGFGPARTRLTASNATPARAAQNQLAAGTLFYVSTDGNDAWSGTSAQPNTDRSDGPVRTLVAARNLIRKLKAGGPLRQPVTVYIHGGIYELPEMLVFTPEDSGTPEFPITYAAYPNEAPVLSGGQTIKGWEPATGVGSGNLWRATVPAVKDGNCYFHQLFVDGVRRQRARTPNTGFFHVDGDAVQSSPLQFKFHTGDIRPAWAAGNVELVILQAWTVARLYIKNVDAASNTVTLSGKQVVSGQEHDARYYVENTLDALDSPGKWYLDRTGVVYYWPLPGEDMTRVSVVASVLPTLVEFRGEITAGAQPGGNGSLIAPVHDIRLLGLTLSYADWSIPADGFVDMQAAFEVGAALEAAGASRCSIEKCTFTHLGQWAVEFGKACQNNRIADAEMADLGAGAVKIGEPKDPNAPDDATTGNVLTNSRLHDIGVVDPGTVGVWIGQSSGNTISHNEIYNTYYTAISLGWTWGYLPTAAHHNVIEYNNMHDIGREMMGDEGCVYSLGVQPGTVIRNNICHDVSRYEHSYGGWGIYTDEGSSHIVIENNIVYRTEDGGFHQHYGQNNIVRNNVFALNRNAQLRRTKNEKGMSFTFEHNLVYWDGGNLLDGDWSDNNFKIDDNLYFKAGDGMGDPIRFGKLTAAEWRKLGHDTRSIIADPLFVDPGKGNFRLKPGSPAAKIGFKPIDVGQVGPQAPSDRVGH